MRSIGKRNIAKLKLLVQEEKDRGGISDLQDRVIARCPIEWFDIWESAHDEIYRIIGDEVMRLVIGT